MAEGSAGEKALDTGITIPLFADTCLKIGPVFNRAGNYPTSQLQKGLILVSNGRDLAEEGVGFGVPVLMLGDKTIFPGEIRLAYLEEGPHQKVNARFLMNLEEKLTSHSRGNVESKPLYRIKHYLEHLYKNFPLSRRPLMALSNALRSSFEWQTTFVDALWNHEVKVNYDIHAEKGIIKIDVDAAGIAETGVTEIFIMNEQGAHHFDMYSDSSDIVLKGEKIGSWNEVTAERASFISVTHRLAFSLWQIDRARLFRGRELVKSRLAWSGFGYSLPPTCQRFTYILRIERIA